MKIIIGIIILIIILIILGLIFRKKLYDKVDYYEAWKLDIMNRNISSDINRLKKLNLEGEAKERYEFFKNEWENIINREAADLEELLYDTEKAADSYNFPKARKYMRILDGKMVEIEQRIEKIVKELTELLEIDQKNAEAREAFEPKLNKLKKYIAKHHDVFYLVESKWDQAIEAIHNQLHNYDAHIEEGSYQKGAEVIKNAKADMKALENEIDDFTPEYQRIKKEIPQELKKLQNGITEMENSGYVIGDDELKEELIAYDTRLEDLLSLLVKDGADPVRDELSKIDDRITEIYDLLENEALAENYLKAKLPNYKQMLDDFILDFNDTKEYVEALKEKYHFDEKELENYLAIEKIYHSLNDKYETFIIDVDANEKAYSEIREALETALEQLGKLEAEHEAFKERTQNIQEDELGAHEKVKYFEEQLNKIVRKLKNNNLPGVPDIIWELVETSDEKNELVWKSLERHPVDIVEVENTLKEAEEAFNALHDKSEQMFEQAFLIERIIQYANRYRSRQPELAAKLKESEKLFRDAEYEMSLETAATALEEVDPSALKRVESLQNINQT